MKLYWYRGNEPNFGDELNLLIWPRLLPGFFDDDESLLFLGTGSIIFNTHATTSRKVVMGAGYGGYTKLPNLSDGSWDFHFVRGPQTAKICGLTPSDAITDSGVLVRTLFPAGHMGSGEPSFMPHIASAASGNWAKVCNLAGLRYIDPRGPVEEVIDQIAASKVVIAEAMHGAIVADALRIPWIPVLPMNPINRMKWIDWTESIAVPYLPSKILPSSVNEWKHSKFHENRMISKGLAMLNESLASDLLNERVAEISARRLNTVASGQHFMSDDRRLNVLTDRILEKVDLFKKTLRV